MIGKVVSFNGKDGVISVENGEKFNFCQSGFSGAAGGSVGASVEFEIEQGSEGDRAVKIVPLPAGDSRPID